MIFFTAGLIWLSQASAQSETPSQAADALTAAVPAKTDYSKLAKNPLFAQLPPNIQEEIIAEAQSMYDMCSTRGNYSNYNDCDCIAIEFINARVNEPDTPYGNLLTKVSPKCPNIPGMAGMAYKSCQTIISSGPKKEAYCNCFANAVANRYAKTPVAHIAAYKIFTKESYSECDKKFPEVNSVR